MFFTQLLANELAPPRLQFRFFLFEKSWILVSQHEMGVFNNILMTHFLEGVDLFRFIRVNLLGLISLWKISHRPQHLLHSLGKHLKFLTVSAAISTVKVQAHASVLHRRKLCWDIMWAVMMSVTSWPCHTHQNKVPVHLFWFLQGNMGRMNTCVIYMCLFASPLAEQRLAGDAHAQRFGTPWQRLM